jgi:hypothetical protein
LCFPLQAIFVFSTYIYCIHNTERRRCVTNISPHDLHSFVSLGRVHTQKSCHRRNPPLSLVLLLKLWRNFSTAEHISSQRRVSHHILLCDRPRELLIKLGACTLGLLHTADRGCSGDYIMYVKVLLG